MRIWHLVLIVMIVFVACAEMREHEKEQAELRHDALVVSALLWAASNGYINPHADCEDPDEDQRVVCRVQDVPLGGEDPGATPTERSLRCYYRLQGGLSARTYLPGSCEPGTAEGR